MKHDLTSVREYWNKSSINYDRIIHDELASFRVSGWQRQIALQVEAGKELKVLDCGCGPAFFTIILAKAGYHVTGVDAAPAMLEAAVRNAKTYGVEAEFREMDCHALDFSDNTFDLIVSRNVTHALNDHRQVYKEWFRVLKPGGVLLIFDANWHLPSASEEIYLDSRERSRKCIEIYGSDFSGNTVFNEKAEFATRSTTPHLLGDRMRPDWDCGILWGIGFEEVTYDRDITRDLWDDKEKLIYGNTPMFMIRAVKRQVEPN